MKSTSTRLSLAVVVVICAAPVARCTSQLEDPAADTGTVDAPAVDAPRQKDRGGKDRAAHDTGGKPPAAKGVGYPRLGLYWGQPQPSTVNWFDNFDLMVYVYSKAEWSKSSGHDLLRAQNPKITILMYDSIIEDEAHIYKQWRYNTEVEDLKHQAWKDHGVEWHYSQSKERTTLTSPIGTGKPNFKIKVKGCGGFDFGMGAVAAPRKYIYFKVFNPSNRAGYEVMKAEDLDGKGGCTGGTTMTVTQRGIGPSSVGKHGAGENVWAYDYDWAPYNFHVRLKHDAPGVANPTGALAHYCHVKPCQYTDWIPWFAYRYLFHRTANKQLFDGVFWDVFECSPRGGRHAGHSNYKGLREIVDTFFGATGEAKPGSALYQTGNANLDFEDSGMNGAMILERNLYKKPYECGKPPTYFCRNMVQEIIERGLNWHGVYTGKLPFILMLCDNNPTSVTQRRFHLVLSTALGGYLLVKNKKEFYKKWIDEVAVDLKSGKAAIGSDKDWSAAGFSGRSKARHYLGHPKGPMEIVSRPLGGPTLVSNGGFEAGAGKWKLSLKNEAKATLKVLSGGVSGKMAHVQISVSDGKNLEDIVLSSGTFPALKPGKVYTVEFWVKASKPRKFDLYVQDALMLWDAFAPARWRRFVYTFKTKTGSKANRVSFRLGRTVGDVFIDGVKVQQGDGFIGYKRAFENGLVLLNPSPAEEGASDTFPVPQNAYRKIKGCSGHANCDAKHNSGELISPANGYACAGGTCGLKVDATDGYILLRK